MQADTFTKSGNKAAASAKLSKAVFGTEVENHELLKQAYVTYLANGRPNLARTKTRGEVRGGGKKPWRQKGTGRARFGSIRVPIWRGGGITFGPTGNENYTKALPTTMKQKAIKQALTLAAKEGKVKVVDAFPALDDKTKTVAEFMKKIGASRNTLFVVDVKADGKQRATANIPNLTVCSANYLNVYDLLNADIVVISQKSLEIIDKWLGGKQ